MITSSPCTSLTSSALRPDTSEAHTTETALDRTDFRADCGRCFALCCTAFGFSRSADFAEDKPAGAPCRHLDSAFGCSIHRALPSRGFRGCTVFDCFGAGQVVSQRLFSGTSWRERPELRDRMFSAFKIVKQLHEMLWYLLEAQERTYDPDTEDEIRELADFLVSLTRGDVDELLSVDMDDVHASVRAVLMTVSAHVRVSYFADGGRVHPRIATEMSFERYTKADLDVLGQSALEIDGWSLTANAKGYALTGRIQPYGLLGLGTLYLNVEDQLGLGLSDDQAAFALRFGGGIDAYVTRSIVLNVEASYLLPTGDLDDFPLVPLSGSIQYRF